MTALGFGFTLGIRGRARPLIPALADPRDLGAALLGYWDAREGVTGTTNVSSWKDRVAGYDLVQANAANQPAFSATGLNGDAAVMFDGTNDFLSMEGVPFPTGSDPSTIWAVADQQAIVSGGRTLFAYGGTTAPSNRRLQRQSTDPAAIASGNGTTNVFATSPTSLTGKHVLRGRVEASQVVLQVDGGEMVTAQGVTITGSTRVRMGASTAPTASLFWQGPIAVVIVTAPLTEGQAAALNGYLAIRRGAAG